MNLDTQTLNQLLELKAKIHKTTSGYDFDIQKIRAGHASSEAKFAWSLACLEESIEQTIYDMRELLGEIDWEDADAVEQYQIDRKEGNEIAAAEFRGDL